MELIMNYLPEQPWIILILIFILLVWNVINSFKLLRMKKRFNIFTRSSKVDNLEEVIVQYNNESIKIKEDIKENKEKIKFILDRLTTLKGNVAIIRYNAFGEEGNDLSYSIAILDENKNGLVISSIYNRGESNTYAKPIENGKSYYKLTSEEIQVMEDASTKQKR